MYGRMDEWKEGVSEWEGEGGKKVSARVKLGIIRANMEGASSGHSLKKRTNNELLLHSQLLCHSIACSGTFLLGLSMLHRYCRLKI